MNRSLLFLLALAAGLIGCQPDKLEPAGDVGLDMTSLTPDDPQSSPAQLPEGVDAPQGWMGQVQASLVASERQPHWEDEGVLLTHRGENLRGTLSDDGALQIVRRTIGGPLASGALDITLRTSNWGRDGQIRSASLGSPEEGGCLPGDKASDVEGKGIARVALRGSGITAWWGSAEAGL